MSTRGSQLLSQYRVYENLVRSEGYEPKVIEDSMPEDKANQMRMVRQFRNFLSHNEVPGFLEPTDKMLKFLDAEVEAWQTKGDVVKKHLRTPAASICEEKEPCSVGLEKLAKMRKTKLVVRNKAGEYELCDLFAIASLFASSRAAKLSVVPRLKEPPVFIAPTTLYSALDRDRVYLCTADGSKDGKLLGVVKV